jgi:hypothetical protein
MESIRDLSQSNIINKFWILTFGYSSFLFLFISSQKNQESAQIIPFIRDIISRDELLSIRIHFLFIRSEVL